MNVNIKQGEDVVISISVISEVGSVQDITLATEVLVILSVNDLPVKHYELGVVAGSASGSCMVDPFNNGIIQVLVRKEHSANFPMGILKANVAYTTPHPMLGTKRSEFSVVVGTVVKGVTKHYIN